MSLVRLTELLLPARDEGTGVGAFNVISIEHAEALVTGAEAAELPVILQISENAIKYHGAFRPIALATLAIAESAALPIVVHLDHATDQALVRQAAELGFGSVMFDGSALDYALNVGSTQEMVEFCHARGVEVEAEIGEVGGKDGVHAPGARTRPAEALAFAQATGVDALAVAVGSSHAMTQRSALLDLDLIADIGRAVPLPLVLHGSSGVADLELQRAIAAGMTKINVATHLNKVFTATVRETLADDPEMVDTRKYLGPGRQAMAIEAARLLRLFNAPRDGEN